MIKIEEKKEYRVVIDGEELKNLISICGAAEVTFENCKNNGILCSVYGRVVNIDHCRELIDKIADIR